MKKKNIIIIASVILISFLLIFILNRYSPLIMDDYSYSYGVNWKRLTSIKDIFLFQKWYYFHWGGRNVAHTIAQFFLLHNKKWLFNVCNTMVFLVMVYLISSFTNKKGKNSILYFILAFLGLWFLTPAYGQAFLWLTGSSNYLWTSTIVLLYLKIFMSIDINKKQSIWKMIGLAIIGIIAGWTNENTGAGLIAMLLVFLFMQYKEKRIINKIQIVGLVSNIIGFAIMILAPGNGARSGGLFKANILIEWVKRTISISSELVLYFIIPIAIIVALVSIYIYKKQKLDKMFYVFLTGIIISTYSMIASPWFPTRSWTIISIYFVLLICILSSNLKIKENVKQIALIDILIILGIVFVREWYIVYQESKVYYNVWEDRRIEMEEGKKQGIYDFQFENHGVTKKQCASYGIDDIFEKKEDSNNIQYARYFGVNSICLKK